MSVVSKDKPYRVGKSRTGLGLFATKPIKSGKKIIRYKGPLVTNDEAEKLDNKYLFEVSKKWTINGAGRANIARYANHACKPNAESDVSAKKRRVIIRAIRDIEPGEEITYDYGDDYFKIFLKPAGCKCASCEKKRAKKAEKKAEKKAKKQDKKRAKAQGSKQRKKPAAQKNKPAASSTRGKSSERGQSSKRGLGQATSKVKSRGAAAPRNAGVSAGKKSRAA